MQKTFHPILKATLFCIAFTGLYILIYFIKSPVFRESEQLAHAIIGIVVASLVTWLFLKWSQKVPEYRFSKLRGLILLEIRGF